MTTEEAQAIIMECDPKYADVIIDRWEKSTGKKQKEFTGGMWSYENI